MVAGNQASVLLSPRLLINGFPTVLSAMKTARVSATFINENDVSITVEDKNYDLKDVSYLDWQVRVPPKVKKLNISVKGKIWSNTEDRWVDLLSSKSYEV